MKTYLYKLLLAPLLCLWAMATGLAQNTKVEKVYVVFKTHLDVGFTDLSSVVTQRYISEFIPKAIDLSERLAKEKSSDRYIWTTGAWLIWKYLEEASPKEVQRLEAAIQRGDIVWNAVPYTVESETMNLAMFKTCLMASRKLDQKYGEKTVAAKMTDVPGHTRSIVKPLCEAGIQFLHIGVNPACPVPGVPPICRWQDTDGSEIILVYQQDYGTESILPGGKVAIAINFTGDNHGPHSYEQVKNIYASLRQRYPKAQIIPASFSDIAPELVTIKDQLPVVTSEIGDTWIYGYGGAPIRMARYRALSNLYSQWIKDGRIDPQSDLSIDFALELGLIAEHTQGVDVKTHIQNWDKYDIDKFQAARSSGPFQKAEQSWKELDQYIDSAITKLPIGLQEEAQKTLRRISTPYIPDGIKQVAKVEPTPWETALLKGGRFKMDGLRYQMFDNNDFNNYLNAYLRAHYGWAYQDIGKPGLDQSQAVSATVQAQVVRLKQMNVPQGKRTIYELGFPKNSKLDTRVFPKVMYADLLEYKDGIKAKLALTIIDKPAVRLPEAYWLSFNTNDIVSIIAEKVGERVNLLDVVPKGNRQMHGIDRYVDLVTSAGTLRIWSPTAFLVNVGEARGINYSLEYPDKKGGIHFNLSNNLWGTNFQMWNEGSLTYHFTFEWIEKTL